MRIASWLVPGLVVPAALAASLGSRSERGSEPECVVAERWAATNSGRLPATLEALSELSYPYRKAAYSRLPRDQPIGRWRDQLRYYHNAPDLTDEQRAFVKLVDQELDEHFGPGASARYLARARFLFGDERARTIFGDLGIPVPTGPTGSRRDAMVSCNCNITDSWCGSQPPCSSAGCLPSGSGCGFLWCHPCNGYC